MRKQLIHRLDLIVSKEQMVFSSTFTVPELSWYKIID